MSDLIKYNDDMIIGRKVLMVCFIAYEWVVIRSGSVCHLNCL